MISSIQNSGNYPLETGKATIPEGQLRLVPVWGVPAGKYSRPIPKFLYRLRAPLRWWSRSIVRIGVREVCMSAARIRAIWRSMHPVGESNVIHIYIPDSMQSLVKEHTLLRSYSGDMERLEKERPYLGLFDEQIFLLGFCSGARTALYTLDIEKKRTEL